MKDIIKLPVEHYLDLIRENKPFSFSRFGDGEVLCIFPNYLKENCDGSKFLPELKQPMMQIFKNQYPYYHCLLDCSFDLNGDKFKDFIEKTCPDMDFYDGEIWQHLSFEGRIGELIEAINPYNPCFVAGKHIQKVKYMYGLDSMRFIETPMKDSYLSYDRIFDDVMKMHSDGCRMFLFSTGYTTKILIDNLFPYLGHNTFLVDIGSLLDCYCGILSRSGMVASGKSKFQYATSLKL